MKRHEVTAAVPVRLQRRKRPHLRKRLRRPRFGWHALVMPTVAGRAAIRR